MSDETDYRWSVEVLGQHHLALRTEILFSPVYGKLDPRDLVAWMVRDRLPARLNLQLHKYIWGRDAKGV